MKDSLLGRLSEREPIDGHPQGVLRRVTSLGAVGVLLLATAAYAAGGEMAEAQARYNSERAACMDGTSNQDRATCLKEAGAALQAARRGGLSTGEAQSKDMNRTDRCNALPQADREECLKRMSGQGTATGSAREGGIYREITTTTVTPPQGK